MKTPSLTTEQAGQISDAIAVMNAAEQAYLARFAELLALMPDDVTIYHEPILESPAPIGAGRVVWTYQKHGSKLARSTAVLAMIPVPKEAK